ncbi:alpha/beta hydrolase [Sphingomonas turrisvirgatae]|uniref:Lysophospholipase n=1 Tax=Sphingomonas turrisvirgatae TaxID=1888892 RepID=A0A1E3LT19_9SPHN|nr:alpha/beta hydrolase [Sphingomonas turrisvirgatae]ODP36869.1 lysophospholipase [Sphingomonas turrisvirgatae]
MNPSPFDRRAIPASAHVGDWHAGDGVRLRRFDWPVDGLRRGSILFQGGRGDMFEKYLEALAHWHGQGCGITSFDWRGQGGSDRVSPAGDCGHIDDFANYIGDLQVFAAEWQAATPGPHVIIGHSMGGHLVLRALAEGAVTPDAAVLIAPMLGLKSPFGASWGERIARLMGGLGDRARPAWKANERPYTVNSRESLLTHDPDRYADELWWQGRDPRIVTGPPSWNWVIEAFRSTRELRANPALANLRVPVLALVAETDGLVDARAALATLARLPDARVMRFGKESAHEILREVDAVRDRALDEIDAFLRARAPHP